MVHAVAEYARLSFWEALELPCDLFMICYKNWVVDRLMQTEEGRKYLDDCERMKKTKLDKEALHRLMERLNRG